MNKAPEARTAVPKLRFPGLVEPWQQKRLGEVADLYKGKGIAKSDISDQGIHQCIRYGELYTTYGEVIEDVISRTSLPEEALFFSEPDDVIIPSSGETKEDIATASCVVSGGIALGGDLNVLRSPESGVFLSYSLNGPLRKEIARVAQGDSVVHLYPHQIEKLWINIPSREEQKKIADCLSSIDVCVGEEARKLDALKAHKQGLMQQLFPAEGQLLPSLRFPGFAGKWMSRPLGRLCSILPGYGFPETLQGRTEGKYPFCKVSDISKAVADNGGMLSAAVNYLGDDELSALRARLIPVGTTVFAKIGEALRLNRRALVRNECLIDNNAVGLKAHPDDADDYFIYLLSQLIDLSRHCGGSVPSVNKTTLEAIEVVVPTPPEQKAIAAGMLFLDELLAAQSAKIASLREHKKGLMQGLFPAPDVLSA